MNIPTQKINKNATFPKRMTESAAGYDLYPCEDNTIAPGEIYPVPTGLIMAIPEGYEGQIRSRSGLSLRGVTVANAPGTIDSDYRGEIKVIIRNNSTESIKYSTETRIAQLVINKVEDVNFTPIEELTKTARGAGGLGHTGTKDKNDQKDDKKERAGSAAG